jgi:hypothetical protein
VPTPFSALDRASVTRRSALAALAAGAALTASACTAEEPSARPGGRGPTRPAVDPDVAAAALVLAEVQGVLDLLTATAQEHRSLRADLEPLRAAHAEHVRLLAEAAPAKAQEGAASDVPSPGSSPSPPVSPPASPSASDGATPPVTVARQAPRALRDLVLAEEKLVASTKQRAFDAESGAFARVLASIAAASAQHAVVLRTAGTGAGS